MTKNAPPKRAVYPRPGSHAETILNFVGSNPDVTTNGIISGLKMNPSTVRKCLATLLERERIVDTPDGDGHHHYGVKTPVLSA